MRYENITDTKRYTSKRLLARLAGFRLSERLRTRTRTIDPSAMPDHLLKDVGLSRQSSAWEDSVGFWRVR